MKFNFFLFSVVSAAIPQLFTTKLEVEYYMLGQYNKLWSPLADQRFDQARWNYVERNYDRSKTDEPSLKRSMDENGNLVRVNMLH